MTSNDMPDDFDLMNVWTHDVLKQQYIKLREENNLLDASCTNRALRIIDLEKKLKDLCAAPDQITLDDVLTWADGIKAAFYTEYASRITKEEAIIADIINSRHITTPPAPTDNAEALEALDDIKIHFEGLIEAYAKKMEWFAIAGRTDNVLAAIKGMEAALLRGAGK